MKIYGRFYFKKTSNSNLIGEYSNYGMDKNQTESADSIESKGNFVGKYLTSWRDGDSAISADLIIEHKPNSNDRIFNLKWLVGKQELFNGQGFLCDDILIGDYTNQKIL
jgi:hypothetical protein